MNLLRRTIPVAVAIALAGSAMVRPTQAWSHQGHILLTRLAALRIIQDEKAPAELRTFLKSQMPYDLAACEKLATVEVIGADPVTYQTGLDGAATLPDRIQGAEEGRKALAPYGMPEAKMHFLDLEYFAKTIGYQPDLSACPKVEDFPHDVTDWRYKQAGFVPFRVEECFGKVVEEFRSPGTMDVAETTRRVGYLAHYLEDSHQPHHSTIDYKSLSYLVGKVKGVREIKTPLSEAAGGGDAISFSAPREINPHGDIEFQLFENADEPRATFRKEFWKELTARIDKHARDAEYQWPEDQDRVKAVYDPFKRDLEILRHSYTYLPAVGKAAQAAYAGGTFDPKAFFTSEDTVGGEKMTMVQIIAEQNARAVLEVEKTLRRAWTQAQAAGPATVPAPASATVPGAK